MSIIQSSHYNALSVRIPLTGASTTMVVVDTKYYNYIISRTVVGVYGSHYFSSLMANLGKLSLNNTIQISRNLYCFNVKKCGRP